MIITYKRDSEKNPVYAIDGIDDFNTDHVFDCGQCFRWRRLSDGSYTGIAFGRIANISYERKTLYIRGLFGTTAPDDIEKIWIPYLDLERDYGRIKRKLCKNDPVMKEAIKSGRGIRILNQDLWETIISFIISQNNNIPRIKKCIEGLADLYGEPLLFGTDKEFLIPKGNRIPGESVHHLFSLEGLSPKSLPTAEKLAGLTEEDLAPIKLGYRAKYLIETAKAVSERGLPGNMEELTELTGVGPKVASCIALFAMGERGSFPIDVWVKRVMNELYGFDLDDMKGMADFAQERFGALAGYAQQYLFYHIRGLDT